MDNKEILTKAIKQATANGWQELDKNDLDDIKFTDGGIIFKRRNSATTADAYTVNDIIYNHQFAKALWGEESPAFLMDLLSMPAWEYHLQQLVIAEDVFKYLEENI